MAHYCFFDSISYLNRILSLSGYTLLSASVALLLQLILYYLVAHHVDAADLGYYFLVSTFIFIPAGIMDFGFVSSLIQKKEVTAADYTAVFRLHLQALLIYIPIGLLIVIALAIFYDKTKLITYFLWLIPFLILWSYITVQAGALKKAFNTQRFALIEIGGTVSMFAMTCGLLMVGWGVTALIAGQLAKVVAMGAGYASYQGKQSISSPFSSEMKKHHWDFGKYVIGEKVFGIGLSYVDIFLVHHFLGPHVLGIYELLKRLVMRPVVSAYVAIEQVTFPLLSKAAGLPAKFSEAFDGIMKFNYFFFFILPLIFIAPWILSFFPESYQLETSLFKWLVLLALAIIIHNPVDIVSYSLGRSKDYYNWVWKYGILQIIVMIFAVQLGIITLIQTTIVYNLIAYVISFWVLGMKESGLSLESWVRPVIIYVLIVSAIVWLW